MTREIKPHKGGRTERIYIRATPETRRLLALIKKQTGKNASDVLEEAIAEVLKKEPADWGDRGPGDANTGHAGYDAQIKKLNEYPYDR